MIKATHYQITAKKIAGGSKTLFRPRHTAIRNSCIRSPVRAGILHYSEFGYPCTCPDCETVLKVKDSKRRYIKNGDGQKIPFNLKRYHCSQCQKLHTEIPDLVEPYRQYEQRTVEEVQKGNAATFAGDDSTIRYWRGKK